MITPRMWRIAASRFSSAAHASPAPSATPSAGDSARASLPRRPADAAHAACMSSLSAALSSTASRRSPTKSSHGFAVESTDAPMWWVSMNASFRSIRNLQ